LRNRISRDYLWEKRPVYGMGSCDLHSLPQLEQVDSLKDSSGAPAVDQAEINKAEIQKLVSKSVEEHLCNSDRTCYDCGQSGHLSRNCTKPRKKGKKGSWPSKTPPLLCNTMARLSIGVENTTTIVAIG
jgi:hypothetical protein